MYSGALPRAPGTFFVHSATKKVPKENASFKDGWTRLLQITILNRASPHASDIHPQGAIKYTLLTDLISSDAPKKKRRTPQGDN